MKATLLGWMCAWLVVAATADAPDSGSPDAVNMNPEFGIPCTGGVFQCEDGYCVEYLNLCDKEPHCPDKSDEAFCAYQIDPTEKCMDGYFECKVKHDCIPPTWRCNGEVDCDDGSDERDCNVTGSDVRCDGFLCGNGNCISAYWECDEEYDCPDRSDEANCVNRSKLEYGPPARASPFCNVDGGYYACADSSFCLQLAVVCDGKRDCKDGSDEGGLCSENCENLNCELGCLRTPTGSSCKCPKGLAHLNRTHCADEDECELYDESCNQRCTNHPGNFTCSCDSGYDIRPDLYTCVARGPAPVLFYNTRDSIQSINIRTKKRQTVIKNLQQAVGVACDGEYVYWTEVYEGREGIYKADLTDPINTKEAIVQTGLETPEDVSIDWVTGTIYFTDGGRAHIAACSSDGNACAIIVTEEVYQPRAIELDVANGTMYWSDWYEVPKIMRSYMDGSHAHVFVSTNITLPNGLALDLPNDRLYWVDARNGGIESIRLDGKHRRKVMEHTIHHPYWLTVFESTIYWSDWGTNSLQAVNKFHEKDRKTLARGRIYGIQMYHPVLEHRNGNHSCHHGLCSDLCLLRGPAEYSCACAEGRELALDKHTCYDAVRPQSLLVVGNTALVILHVHSLGKFDIAPHGIGIGKIEAVTYNHRDEVIYLFDRIQSVIKWIHLDSLSKEAPRVLVTGLKSVVDMAYDDVAEVLYWIDAGAGIMEAYSIKRSARALVYKFDSDETPLSMTLVQEYKTVIVSILDANNNVHVDSLGMEGLYRTHLFENGFKGPMVHVRYHAQVGYLFMADYGNGVIETSHPLGTSREVFRSVSTKLWSVAGVGSDIFWTDANSLALYWTNAYETLGSTARRVRLDVFSPFTKLLLAGMPHRRSQFDSNEDHPCAARPSPCSHVCLQRSETDSSEIRHRCLCPLGMFLFSENGTCVEQVACSEGSVLCALSNQCVPAERRCDGRADCLHGEDEEDCSEVQGGKATCSGGRFACGSGECVTARRRCDKHVDCRDGSDEASCEDHASSHCTEEQFDCGADVCIDRRLVCDDAGDCPDATDEDDCDTPTCGTGFFQCKVGNCVPTSWECDGELDCNDGSDEHLDCKLTTDTAGTANSAQCGDSDWRCLNGGCVPLSKRCDARQDCTDGSDELDCEEEFQDTICDEMELICLTNRSICLPIEARCNGTSECPNGEDEIACKERGCTAAEWRCHDGRCVSYNFVCDHVDDCKDGSDETKEACKSKNVTRVLPETGVCGESGFQCDSGHCLDMKEVCNGIEDCPDGTDEHGSCDTACAHNKCLLQCVSTPRGGRCACPPGFKLGADKRKCVDRNECAEGGESRPCAHVCTNVEGGFVCNCHPGFVIRSDRRSCKAVGGPARVVLSAGGEVWSAPARTPSRRRLLYSAPYFVADVAVHYRAGYVFLASAVGGAVYRVPLDPGNNDANIVTITNIGTPNKIAVDWRTGALYISDSSYSRFHICDVTRLTCAVFHHPEGATVTALATEPARALFIYCTAERVMKREADGSHESQLAQVDGCSALAPDSHAGTVYVSYKPDAIMQLYLDGSVRRRIVSGDRRMSAPRSLAYFEDTLYLLSEIGNKLTHCRLFGGLACESALVSGREGQQVTAATLAHQALEPVDDITPACAEDSCPDGSVCVASVKSPRDHVCLCPSGEPLSRGSECVVLPTQSMAVMQRGGRAGGGGGGWRAALGVTGVLLLIAAAATGYMYHKKNYRSRSRTPFSVFFRRRAGEVDEDSRLREVPSAVEIAPEQRSDSGRRGLEFVNPLRDAWRSVQGRFSVRPPATSATDTLLNVPIADSDSDVESDRDNDKARLI